jgi:hypothetical protein
MSSLVHNPPTRLHVRLLVKTYSLDDDDDNDDTATTQTAETTAIAGPSYQTFDVSVADLVARELEMLQVASAYEISSDQWSGSRLYQEYKKHCQLERKQTAIITCAETEVEREPPEDEQDDDCYMEITLDPMGFCHRHNLCVDPRSFTHGRSR